MKSRILLLVLLLTVALLAVPDAVPTARGESISLEETDPYDDVKFLSTSSEASTDVSGQNSVDILRASVKSEGEYLNFSVTLAGPVMEQPEFRFTFHLNSTVDLPNHKGKSLWLKFKQDGTSFESWLYDAPTDPTKVGEEIPLSYIVFNRNKDFDNSFAIKILSGMVTNIANWSNIEIEAHQHEVDQSGNISDSFFYDKVYIKATSPPADDPVDGGDGDEPSDGGDGDEPSDGGDGGEPSDGGDGTADGGDGGSGGGTPADGATSDSGDETDERTMLTIIIVLVLVFMLLFLFTLTQKMKIDREMEEVRRKREERQKGKGKDKGKKAGGSGKKGGGKGGGKGKKTGAVKGGGKGKKSASGKGEGKKAMKK